jgi:muramoyltetrapeptide carboxypeptidase
MIKPRALRPGDRIAIVAPASGFERDALDRGVEELAALGFRPTYDNRILARRSYVAGDPSLRASALLDAWQDDEVAALIAVRGGYGSVHVLPLLDPALLRQYPKLFIGYSDNTSLLTVLTQQCGMVAIHGPMLQGRFARGEAGYDRASFLGCVTRPHPLGELPAPGLESLCEGEASGPLTGGTLTQLVASLGTPYAFDPPEGSILFLEDVDERPYRLDRMVTQLRLSGMLARVRAVVWGEMRGCCEPDGGLAARETLAELFDGFPGPVLIGLPSGHTTGPMLTIPFGVRTRVIGGRRALVVIEEAAVQA